MDYMRDNKYINKKIIKKLFYLNLLKCRLINHSINNLIVSLKIYTEIIQLKNLKNNILEICYEKGLLHVLKNLHKNNHNIFIRNAINKASSNGHVAILKWFHKSCLEFHY